MHILITFIKKEGVVLRYINKVKYGYGVGLPISCGYQHCGEICFVIAMFSKSYFALPVLHIIFNKFL